MDQLPDEILSQILKESFDCPSEILQRLGLVCKRWQELCKDRYVWAEVDICLTDELSREAFKRYAKTLMKAPRLRALSVECDSESGHRDILLKCLQCCTESTKKVQHISVETCFADVLHHLSVLIKNSLDTLQGLRLKLTNFHLTPHQKCTICMDGHDDILCDLMFHSQRLQELDISLDDSVSLDETDYTSGVPPLKKLRIQSLSQDLHVSLAAFTRHILEASSETLERVQVHLRHDTRIPLPCMIFPNLSSITLGFLDDPRNMNVQNTPNLSSISFGWHIPCNDGFVLIRSTKKENTYRCQRKSSRLAARENQAKADESGNDSNLKSEEERIEVSSSAEEDYLELFNSLERNNVTILVGSDVNEVEIVAALRKKSSKNGLLLNENVANIQRKLKKRKGSLCYTSDFELTINLQHALQNTFGTAAVSILVIRTPSLTGTLTLSGNYVFWDSATVYNLYDVARGLAVFCRPFSSTEVQECIHGQEESLIDKLLAVGLITIIPRNKIHNLELNRTFYKQLFEKRETLRFRHVNIRPEPEGMVPLAKFYSATRKARDCPYLRAEGALPMKRKKPSLGKGFDLRMKFYRHAKEVALCMPNPKTYLSSLPEGLSKKINAKLTEEKNTGKLEELCFRSWGKRSPPVLKVSYGVEFYIIVFNENTPLQFGCIMEFCGNKYEHKPYEEILREYFKPPKILFQPRREVPRMNFSEIDLAVLKEKQASQNFEQLAIDKLRNLLCTPPDREGTKCDVQGPTKKCEKHDKAGGEGSKASRRLNFS